ncbi:PREDICTED: secretogranin-1 [Tinamus guttatus]|uniref:secretogranin-1 n=1 Tax=Tinamus guttatus TaxID=94827 RepID=UPI00052F3A1F|nr:PREDICTED: secretogranin-1 [Tinamus guttatus]
MTGVSAVPADKDHIEEMVTQCIVEVLSNALSKSNAPPINPECKEILRKSGKSDRAKNEDKQLEMRHLKDSAENEEHGTGSVEEERSQAEMESKMRVKGSDEKKLGWEEDHSEEEEDGHDISVHEAREEQLQTAEVEHHEETGEDQNSYYREEESKESRHRDEEAERAAPSKQSASAEQFLGGNDQHSMGWARAEERTQRPGKRVHEGEEGEAAGSEKSHHEPKERDSSHQHEQEESAESEEAAEEKQGYAAERYYRKHRMGDSEEMRARSGERGKLAEESNAEHGRPWDRRNHHQQQHREEAERHREEKGGHRGRHGSEEVEEKSYTDQGGEEHGERRQQSEESSEEESKRQRQSEESHEKWQEERRHHDASRETGRHRPEGRTYGGEEDLGRDNSAGSKEEKQQRGAERRRLQDSEEVKLSVAERRGQVRRHYSTEDRASAERQRYPVNREDAEKQQQSSDQTENEENTEEGRYTEREQYKSPFPAESGRSSAVLHGPLHSLLRWKSHRAERRDSVGEQLLGSKEEARPALGDKNLLPEYDYDWWEKKQILNALKHGRTEKRNLGKINRFDVKRQYNRMDQLAQLLNYRKKSAEFPELYDSGEDLKKRHVIRNDRGNLSERPLTEEEEKELENLAAMDLELQKIAEKLNDNRRG